VNLNTTLTQLEARLQALIEERTGLLFSAPRGLAGQFAAAMQAGLAPGADGQLTAPDNYTLTVHPERAALWQANPAWLEELAAYLLETGVQAGFSFPAAPSVRVVAEAALDLDERRVTALITPTTRGDTAAQPSAAPLASAHLPPGAFLIIDSAQTFPLTAPVINIGRRAGNDLVINNPHVSREHAQLRAIRGSYVIFDLDSTSGTFVNNQRISQAALHPGDVILLGSVPLIYGQESPDRLSTQELRLEDQE
jgi:hypothetical protein